MSLYNPLGFITPLTIRLKWMLQQLSTAEGIKGWDDELSIEQKQPWAQLLSEMVTQGSISFPRSCKPEDIDLLQAAILIVYMDGSDVAKAFAAYIRYILMSGLAYVSLLSSKAKLNSAGGQSTPRSELDGHTLGHEEHHHGSQGCHTQDN